MAVSPQLIILVGPRASGKSTLIATAFSKAGWLSGEGLSDKAIINALKLNQSVVLGCTEEELEQYQVLLRLTSHISIQHIYVKGERN